MKTVVLTLISVFAIGATSIAQTTAAQADSAAFYFKLGMAAKSAGKSAVAYQNFERAIHFKPTEEYLKQAGFAALELRKYEFARQHFEHVYNLNNNDTTAIIQLAQLQFSLRRWNEAIRWANIMRQK